MYGCARLLPRNEQPFRIGPDPRFLYLSDQVQETLAKCEYMAKERIGPLYISGLIGGGKTSILRRLYEKLSADERYRVTMLISPNVKPSNAFLRIILATFDGPDLALVRPVAEKF